MNRLRNSNAIFYLMWWLEQIFVFSISSLLPFRPKWSKTHKRSPTQVDKKEENDRHIAHGNNQMRHKWFDSWILSFSISVVIQVTPSTLEMFWNKADDMILWRVLSSYNFTAMTWRRLSEPQEHEHALSADYRQQLANDARDIDINMFDASSGMQLGMNFSDRK